ncbi:MAG: hypothetical protein NTY15_11085 [Planctomycetota bacterium]|nr:hypothetical protein [Planctomycetota bacterium]
MRYAAILITLFVIVTSVCGAQETVDKETVDSLVARLASKNKPPKTRGPSALYPRGYDKAGQEEVFLAYRELRELGPKAFPFIIPHLDDKRYSLTADGGAADVNFTVGQLCFSAIDLQLQPYKTYSRGEGDPRNRPRRPHYLSKLDLRDPEKTQNWINSLENKTLLQLQIEVLEWVIEAESKERTKYPSVELDWLHETLEILKKAKEPLPSGVPWAK